MSCRSCHRPICGCPDAAYAGVVAGPSRVPCADVPAPEQTHSAAVRSAAAMLARRGGEIRASRHRRAVLTTMARLRAELGMPPASIGGRA